MWLFESLFRLTDKSSAWSVFSEVSHTADQLAGRQRTRPTDGWSALRPHLLRPSVVLDVGWDWMAHLDNDFIGRTAVEAGIETHKHTLVTLLQNR